MGKARDLLMRGHGVNVDDKTDEEVHAEVRKEMAARGQLPDKLDAIFDEALEELKGKEK